MLYVRIAVYGRIRAAPYRKKVFKSQNTAVNVRSVTVLKPDNYGRNRIRYGEKPYSDYDGVESPFRRKLDSKRFCIGFKLWIKKFDEAGY